MSDTPESRLDALLREPGASQSEIIRSELIEDLKRENAALRERIDKYISIIHQLWGRPNPELEYVEGTAIAYGADEIDRLNARIAELEEALWRSCDTIGAFTDPEGNMPEDTGEFRELHKTLLSIRRVLGHQSNMFLD